MILFNKNKKQGKANIKRFFIASLLVTVFLSFLLALTTASDEISRLAPSIGLNLLYGNDKLYDSDNDGVETLKGVIDFNINTTFNWNVSYENLCAKWEVYSFENQKTTTICHGKDECCALLDLKPEKEFWDESFYLNYGKYGSTYNNTISTQIIFANYSLNIKDPYSEIINSSIKTKEAHFTNDKIIIISAKDKENKKIGEIIVTEYPVGTDLTIEFKNNKRSGLGISSNSKGSRLDIQKIKNKEKFDSINIKLDKSSEKHITTDVLFIGEDIEIDDATLTLRKHGNVDYVFHCTEFMQESFTCIEWEKTNIPFEEDQESITFVVEHFTAYAGGIAGSSENSSLIIWDEVDASMPYAGSIKYADSPIRFFANYTNQSFSINGSYVFCNISFNDTDITNKSMEFNYSASFYQFNKTFTSKGVYRWNVTCNDTSTGYSTLNATDTITITNTAPIVAKDAQNKLPEITCYENYLCFYNFSQNVTDADNTDILNYSSNAYDIGLTIFNMGKTTGVVNFTANVDADTGTYDVTLIATDSSGSSDSASKKFTIVASNDAPEINLSSISTIEDTAFSFDVSSVTTDEETNTPYAFSDNCTFFAISGAGAISFTPDRNDVGNHSVNISVIDSGGATGFSVITFQVNYTNHAPSFDYICDNERNTTENMVFSCTVNGTDVDGNALTFTSNTSWFSINSSGFVNFTPTDIAVSNNITILLTANDSQGGINTTLINFSVKNVNDFPIINNPGSFNITAGRYFNYSVNVTDNDTLTAFGENLTFWSNSTVFNISSDGWINFTPSSNINGTYSINISVNDTQNISDSIIINFTISGNFPPTINFITPYGTPLSNTTVNNMSNITNFPDDLTSISIIETQEITFNHNSSDPDNDTLIYSWYYNGTLNSTASNFNLTTDYYDQGLKNVTLIISDGGYQDTFTWNVTVTDNNRLPVFGILYHVNASDFDGTNNNTNSTSQPGNITLNYDGTSYPKNGTFVSKLINFNSPAKDTVLTTENIRLINISWNAVIPNGTNITLQTRTSSDGSTFTNYSANYTNSQGEIILSPNDVYFQYMAKLTTENTSFTPVIENVTITYGIGSITFNENDIQENWVDLDYFFSEVDLDNNITYGYTNVTNVNITIKENNVVKLDPAVGTYGEKYVMFYADDGTNITYSNNVTINVSHVSNSTIIVQYTTSSSSGGGGGGGGGGGASSTRIQLERVTQIESVNLLEPGAIEVVSPNELKVPIKLINNKTEIFKGITLSAHTNLTGVSLGFKRNYFGQLLPGNTEETELLIETEDILPNSFSIIVEGSVIEPEYTDRVVISITPLSEEIKRSLLFVRDILTSNPECLELNENLKEVESYIKERNYEKANAVLSSTIEACKYLLSKKKDTDSSRLSPKNFDLISVFTNKVTIILLLLFVILIITIVVMYKEYKNLE